MSVRVLPPTNKLLVANTTTERFDPWTDWFPCTGIDEIVWQLILRNVSGNFKVRPGIQYAATTTSQPDAFTGIGTAVTTNNAHQFKTTPSAADKYYARLGAVYALSSGSTEASGEVSLLPILHSSGREVGTKVLEINPGMGDTVTVSWFETTEWFPAVNLDKAKVALIVEQNAAAGSLKYIIGCRLAIDASEPGAWADIEGGTWQTPGAGNSYRNTNLLSFPAGVTSNVFAQLGIGITKQDSGDLLRAILKISNAISWL